MEGVMDCLNCGGHINLIQQDYSFDTKELGIVVIPLVNFYTCGDCGDKSLLAKEARRVDAYINAKVAAAIGDLPIGSFITLNEAAELLGISKQAFSKHKRISRGFIYFVRKGNQKLYYKPSVEKFRDSQDGRILLLQSSLLDRVSKIQDTDMATWFKEFLLVSPPSANPLFNLTTGEASPSKHIASYSSTNVIHFPTHKASQNSGFLDDVQEAIH
jgi:hypothetical protein